MWRASSLRADSAHETWVNTADIVSPSDWGPALLQKVDFPNLLAQGAPLHVSTLVIVLVVAAAAALSIPQVTWRWFGLFTTLVHELGHAFAGALCGRVVHGIQVHQNHSGSTLTSGYGTFSAVISGFFGYPAPALVGAGLLWSAFNGFSAQAFLAGTAVTLLTLLFIRNWFGLLVVVATALVSGSLWFFGTSTVQGFALLIIGVSLLVGAVRGLVTVITVHTSRRDQLATSDAYILYSRTMIPSPLWLLGFTAVIGWCGWVAMIAFAGTLA